MTLSNEQRRLLDLFVAANYAKPKLVLFTCLRLMRVGFTWIMHDGFDQDVHMAQWDDVLSLDCYGLVKLHIADDNHDGCSFVLTPLASTVHTDCRTLPRCSVMVNIPVNREGLNLD